MLTDPRAAPVLTARRLAKRAFRAADKAFLAEGPQAVREALADDRRLVRTLYVTEESAARHVELLRAAAVAEIAVHTLSGQLMSELSQTVTPQGVLAICRYLDQPVEQALAPGVRLAVLLAAVRDPGNAGTVVRTADAAGAQAVVFDATSVDAYNGKCVRASAGSLFHLGIATDVDLATAVAQARAAGLAVLAAHGGGADGLDELADAGALDPPTAWLFGNEAWGLPDDVLALADRVVRVPIHGRAESLNLAAAAAVCLYASARAQRGR